MTRHTRELYFLAGTCCLLLAHASQNLGNPRAAQAQIRTARACANQADHQPLRAWITGTAALVTEWSPRHPRALRLAEEAAELTPAGQSRIRIAAIEARAAACSGDHRRALAALARMKDAQDESPALDEITDIGGILAFPVAKQDYYIGAAYGLLGRFTEAEVHAVRAVNRYRRGPQEDRSYGDEALATIDIARARIADGDLPTAAHVLQSVLELPYEQRIRQLGPSLRTVVEDVQRSPLSTTDAARDLLHRIDGYRVLGASALPSLG